MNKKVMNKETNTEELTKEEEINEADGFTKQQLEKFGQLMDISLKDKENDCE